MRLAFFVGGGDCVAWPENEAVQDLDRLIELDIKFQQDQF